MICNRFRWVFCQLEVLRHCFPSNLRRILEELPKSLDDTYKRILRDINNANQGHAYLLLPCLTVACRPLRVEELAEVLAVDLSPGGIPKLNEDWRWENQEEAVLSACSSLVSVIMEHGSRVVQFSHFSVKEFLTSDRLTRCTEESQFHIPVEDLDTILSQACLGVLLSVDKPHFWAWVRTEFIWHLSTGFEDEDKQVRPSAAPLYFAAWLGFRDLVERLVIKDPQHVHLLGGRCGTPLHASVHRGHLEVAQFLFAHGIDINLRNAHSSTPLHIASEMGHLKIVKWLLNHGADVNSQDVRGDIPLHYLASHGDLDVCRILLEHGAVANTRGKTGSTPFLEASKSGPTDIIWSLLDHNPDVNVCDSADRGYTPLHYAAMRGLLELVQKLLELNAEINSCSRHKSTPLLLASQLGYADVVRVLLDYKADVYACDGDADTALHCAALGGHPEMVRIFLKLNLDVNSRNNAGSTSLDRASERCRKGSTEVVRLLLDCGADMQARNFRGQTASEVARQWRQHRILQLLSQHTAE